MQICFFKLNLGYSKLKCIKVSKNEKENKQTNKVDSRPIVSHNASKLTHCKFDAALPPSGKKQPRNIECEIQKKY